MALVKFTGVNPEELKKLEQVMKDDDFVEALTTKTSAEEVKDALAAKGINFTLEEVMKIKETLDNADETENLSEADLENVSGGVSFTLIDIEWKTKKGTVIKLHIPW